MRFEVVKIEFEFSKDKETLGETYMRSTYINILKEYVPKINSMIESHYVEGTKLKFEFKKPISLNTVNNSISLFMNRMNIKIDEIEYDVKSKTVEVEVNDE